MFNKDMFIKPKIALEGALEGVTSVLKKPAPDGKIMVECPGCKRALFVSELKDNASVCPACGHHMRIGARRRIRMLVDRDSFLEHDAEAEARDSLIFPQYDQKLYLAKEQSGEREAVITGRCTIDGNACALFAMDPGFMMGSMSPVVGDKVTRLFEYATEHRLPVVGFTVSGGARIQEGILSLMQMAKTSGAVGRHSDAGLFYLTVLTDPTTGGVTASFAMLGDIIISEPGALIGFAGPRVIEQTMRQTLPDGFQRAEFLLKKGFVDKIVDRRQQRTFIADMLRLHTVGGAK
jgi:acetyl-CoA carboxylase carboxyl transferase beta subunit